MKRGANFIFDDNNYLEPPNKKIRLENRQEMVINKDKQNTYSLEKYIDYIHEQAWVSSLWNPQKSNFAHYLASKKNTPAKATNLSLSEILFKAGVAQRVKNDLIQWYPIISKFIEDSLIAAKNQNKSLLLLIGECHNHLPSSFMEALILQILANYSDFCLKKIFTEAFTNNPKPKPTIAKPDNVVEEVADVLNLTTIPIDLAVSNISFKKPIAFSIIDYDKMMAGTKLSSPPIDKSSMQKRNQIMSDVMRAFKNEGHAVAIVGGAHLYGLMKETDLHKDYYVVPICTTDKLPKSKGLTQEEKLYSETCLNFLSSKEVKTLCLMTQIHNIPAKHFTSQEVLALVQEVVTQPPRSRLPY